MASEPNAVSVQAVSVPVPQPDPQGAGRRALYKAVARYGRDDPRVRQILGPRFEREGRRQRRGRDGVEGEDVGQRPGVEVVLELAADIARGNRGTSAARTPPGDGRGEARSEEHTSELQSLMRISYAVFCLKKKKTRSQNT